MNCKWKMNKVNSKLSFNIYLNYQLIRPEVLTNSPKLIYFKSKNIKLHLSKTPSAAYSSSQ